MSARNGRSSRTRERRSVRELHAPARSPRLGAAKEKVEAILEAQKRGQKMLRLGPDAPQARLHYRLQRQKLGRVCLRPPGAPGATGSCGESRVARNGRSSSPRPRTRLACCDVVDDDPKCIR